MEERFVKTKTLKYESLEYFLEHIDELNNIVFSFEDSCVINRDEDPYVYLVTTEEEPIAYGTTIFSVLTEKLYINPKYYEKNKDYVDGMLKEIVRRSNKDTFVFSENMKIEDYLDIVLNNPNIKIIYLKGKNKDFKLTEELYHKFKECGHIEEVHSDGVVESLSELDDPLIRYNHRTVYSSYSKYDLMNLDSLLLSIDKDFKKEELAYFKYLKPGCNINVYGNDYDKLIEVMNVLKLTGNNYNFVIPVDNKNEFNRFCSVNLNTLNLFNVKVKLGVNEYDLDTYVNYEKRLMKMIEPALSLSPLEKYLFAYNIVKKFKPYKENEDDKSASRNVYELLDNEYMVCVGFSSLLIDLLNKLGIEASDLSVSVAVGMEKNPNEDMVANDIVPERGYHARTMVYLNDPKYGIDGIYFADPTWDNDMEKDLYLYSLLTQNEYKSMHRENFMSTPDYEIFDSSSIEEFFMKVNYFLNKKYEDEKKQNLNFVVKRFGTILKKLENTDNFDEKTIISVINEVLKNNYGLGPSNFYVGYYDKNMIVSKIFTDVVDDYSFKSKKSIEDLKELVENKIKSVLKQVNKDSYEFERKFILNLLGFFKDFNFKVYSDIISKYPKINSYDFRFSNEEISDIITTLGEFIVSVNNNFVSGDTIFSALREVYKANGVSEELIDDMLTIARKENKEKFLRAFPKRMKINPDGTMEVYCNEVNKFDDESENIKLS